VSEPARAAASGKPSEVVSAIERELSSIWSVPDPATGVAKVRASTLNYVAASGVAALDELRAMTDQLAETHAGRVLLLWVDGRLAPWEIAHEVSGVCRPGAGTSVCNDRVEIGFGAVAAERAASVVRTLALPEIPIVAEIAAGAPGTLAHALAGVARRLVVDSHRMRLGPIVELLGKAQGPLHACTLADRAWIRAYSWRELVARFFDDRPETTREIRRVRVQRARLEGAADPAHLLLGWLSSRLGWTEIGRGGARRQDGGTVEVLVEDASDGCTGPGELSSVAIVAGEGRGEVTCDVARVAGGRDVRWRLCRAEEGCVDVERELALGHRDETWVLVKAIESTDGDQAYREALIAGARWEAWGA
jgi:glucose-6-phosphate dehydrogenase assembly protein OpcA